MLMHFFYYCIYTVDALQMSMNSKSENIIFVNGRR